MPADNEEDLPAACELLRYVSSTQYDEDVVDGGAFRPKPKDNGDLSLNRRGVFSDDRDADFQQLRKVRAQWMTIRKSGRFAEITRAAFEEVAAEYQRTFSFRAAPERDLELPDDPSHCLIGGIPDDDEERSMALRDMIATKVIALLPAVPE